MQKLTKLDSRISPKLSFWARWKNLSIIGLAIEKELKIDLTQLPEKEICELIGARIKDADYVYKAWEDFFGEDYIENGKFSQYLETHVEKDFQNPAFQKAFSKYQSRSQSHA